MFVLHASMTGVTSSGSPYQRFKRALGTQNPLLAWAACAELPRVGLDDALALVLLLARSRDPNFHRACSRWVARYTQQTECDAAETELLRAALVALSGSPDAHEAGVQTVRSLLTQRQLERCIAALETRS